METMTICTGCQRAPCAGRPGRAVPELSDQSRAGTGVDIGPNSRAEGGQTRERAWKVELVLRPLTHQVRLQCRRRPRGHRSCRSDASLAPYVSTGVSLEATPARLPRKSAAWAASLSATARKLQIRNTFPRLWDIFIAQHRRGVVGQPEKSCREQPRFLRIGLLSVLTVMAFLVNQPTPGLPYPVFRC